MYVVWMNEDLTSPDFFEAPPCIQQRSEIYPAKGTIVIQEAAWLSQTWKVSSQVGMDSLRRTPRAHFPPGGTKLLPVSQEGHLPACSGAGGLSSSRARGQSSTTKLGHGRLQPLYREENHRPLWPDPRTSGPPAEPMPETR